MADEPAEIPTSSPIETAETGYHGLPVNKGAIDLFGYMAGTIKIVGDIVSPLPIDWTGDEENI